MQDMESPPRIDRLSLTLAKNNHFHDYFSETRFFFCTVFFSATSAGLPPQISETK